MTYDERRLARYDSLRKQHRGWSVPVYVICVVALIVGLMVGVWDNGLGNTLVLMVIGWTGGYCSLAIIAFVLGLPPQE